MGEGASSLASGAVFGRYVLVEKIGRGAMGEVWVAIDPDLDRKVALKLLRADRIARPEDRTRLETEARLMARLSHPNVVTVHDVGELDGRLFITMEYVDGETLDRWIARGPHPWTDVLALMREAAGGLAAAHGVGLVHRDFKPANVMIGHDGRVRVLDFGLARPEGAVATDGETTARSVTLDSGDGDPPGRSNSDAKRIQGSPAYMAPEQHRNATVDARSDLFAFCVSLFEALYGVRPFRGGNRLAVALAIVEGRMLELPTDVRARVPDWIHAIVLRGLAGDPAQRFADMDELIAALERSPEQRRRQRLRIAGVGAAVVAAVVMTIAFAPKRELDACAAAGDAIAEDWSAELRERLRTRIDASASAKPQTADRLVEGLDRYTASWSGASVQLCRDRRARRLTERLQATREACLSERREALAALVRRDDPAFVDALAARPFVGLRALGEPARCVERAVTGERQPLDAESLAARVELGLELALLDDRPPSEALLARLGDEVEGDPELALLLARVAASRGQRAEATAKLHAAAAASTAGEPELAAQAWLALTGLELAALDDVSSEDARARIESRARAQTLLDYADALTPEDDLAARAQLGLYAGRLALLEDRPRPPALLDTAIERLAADPSSSPDLQIALLELRSELERRAGRDAEAAGDHEQAERLAIATFGGE